MPKYNPRVDIEIDDYGFTLLRKCPKSVKYLSEYNSSKITCAEEVFKKVSDDWNRTPLNCNVFCLQAGVEEMKRKIGGRKFKVVEYDNHDVVFGFKLEYDGTNYVAVVTKTDCYLIKSEV